jgi:hypothetical protein
MPFQNKIKNRRSGREDVLEVKMHSKHVRAARLRLFGVVTGWILGVAFLAAFLWRGTGWVVEEFVYKNSTFAIRTIEVETDGIIPPGQLREWSGAKEGDNLFALDLHRIERDLELNSLIEHAAVERILPNTLSIRVTEREPVAQFTAFLSSPNHGLSPVKFYFDAEGHVLMPSDLPALTAQMAERFDFLPKLTGVDRTELIKGRPVESPRIRAALRLIRQFNQSAMSERADLDEVNITTPPVLEALTRQGGRITLGYDGLEMQIQRWRAVHDYAGNAGKGVATLDLSVTNNIPARWLEAGVTPPVPPKGRKTTIYRKKHV